MRCIGCCLEVFKSKKSVSVLSAMHLVGMCGAQLHYGTQIIALCAHEVGNAGSAASTERNGF